MKSISARHSGSDEIQTSSRVEYNLLHVDVAICDFFTLSMQFRCQFVSAKVPPSVDVSQIQNTQPVCGLVVCAVDEEIQQRARGYRMLKFEPRHTHS